jgi:hypothetical protein
LFGVSKWTGSLGSEQPNKCSISILLTFFRVALIS